MTDAVIEPTFDAWRATARDLLRAGTPPEAVHWREAGSTGALFDQPPAATGAAAPESTSTATDATRIPRAFLSLAASAACVRDTRVWPLLYRVLWRLTHDEPNLLAVSVDPDTHQLETWSKAVRRDAHKMKAFVRFRRIADGDAEAFVAWFEPTHRIVARTAPFFARRYANQHWSILTPDACAHWDCQSLTFTPGVHRDAAPTHDILEDHWRTYFAHIFNPARHKPRMMRSEMPEKYWHNLPEARLIPELERTAARQTARFLDAPTTDPDTQPRRAAQRRQIARALGGVASDPATPWQSLVRGASTCTACPLHTRATQTVFGVGPLPARLVLIGEQPGDREDLDGQPFVGPAGAELDAALAAVGLDRESVYLTNAVKHFKWRRSGKRRLHARPAPQEIEACRGWLDGEMALAQPAGIVCLGTSAARAVSAAEARVGNGRNPPTNSRYRVPTWVTWHPSAILRAADAESANRQRAALVATLADAAARVAGS